MDLDHAWAFMCSDQPITDDWINFYHKRISNFLRETTGHGKDSKIDYSNGAQLRANFDACLSEAKKMKAVGVKSSGTPHVTLHSVDKNGDHMLSLSDAAGHLIQPLMYPVYFEATFKRFGISICDVDTDKGILSSPDSSKNSDAPGAPAGSVR